MKKIISKIKRQLAKRGLIILIETVDKARGIYKVYCPKCETWHIVHLSGYPGEEHLHLPCGEVIIISR